MQQLRFLIFEVSKLVFLSYNRVSTGIYRDIDSERERERERENEIKDSTNKNKHQHFRKFQQFPKSKKQLKNPKSKD